MNCITDILNSIDITPIWYLIPSLLMFCAGVYGFMTRKNMIAMLISIELMLNAVDINFVVFNRFFFPHSMEGMFFTLFAIAIAAAETALAIAIIINIYRAVKNVDVTSVNEMKF
ncbi:MAG: NADH-quinone oxidoreductase subunit NuoK [Muribaculaceae bacterium]